MILKRTSVGMLALIPELCNVHPCTHEVPNFRFFVSHPASSVVHLRFPAHGQHGGAEGGVAVFAHELGAP